MRDALALLARLEAVGVLHHLGDLRPQGLVRHVRGEEVHGIKLAELVVLDAVTSAGAVLGHERGIGDDEGAKAGIFGENGGGALGGGFDKVREAAGDVNDSGEVPFCGWVLWDLLVMLCFVYGWGNSVEMTLISPPPLQFTDIVVSVSSQTLVFFLSTLLDAPAVKLEQLLTSISPINLQTYYFHLLLPDPPPLPPLPLVSCSYH